MFDLCMYVCLRVRFTARTLTLSRYRVAMSEQTVVKRVAAALGRLASLPERQIRRRFESVSDDELEAYQTVVDDAVGTADQVVGANAEDPPPPPSLSSRGHRRSQRANGPR